MNYDDTNKMMVMGVLTVQVVRPPVMRIITGLELYDVGGLYGTFWQG